MRNKVIETYPSRTASNAALLLPATFIALPLLSFALSLLGWLVYGVDIPFMDDWRPYILDQAGTFELKTLFTPANDTLFPVGMAFDSAAMRWLGGNSIAYQALSMSVVLLSLLALQWLMLRHVLRDKLITACAFCLTLLMLQPGSYWGEQNMAFHQAFPLVGILTALYLAVVSRLPKSILTVSLLILGLVCGFTYISGAFAYLACGLVLAFCSLARTDAKRQRLTWSGLTMAFAGLVASIPQAWVIVFYQKGTHRVDAPMAFPYEVDFWFYLLGKVARSLLLPVFHPALSLALTLIAVGLLLTLLGAVFVRARSGSVDENSRSAMHDGLAITLSLSAVAAVYLLMVAAGRANLRDPGMTSGLQIFQFGYLRFHFFWATLLWPWLAGLGFAWWYAQRSHTTPWLLCIIVSACTAGMAAGGAFNHMEHFRQLSAARIEGVNCLRSSAEAMKPMMCNSIEIRDLRPALLVAERAGASFTRYLNPGAASETPAAGPWTKVVLIRPGAFVDGSFLADRSGSISSMAVPIGNFDRTSDGELEVSVCNRTRCVSGIADLSKSLDNSYLDIDFAKTVAVQKDARILFRIRTHNATRPVALWTSASTPASAQILRVREPEATEKTVPGQTIGIRTWYIR